MVQQKHQERSAMGGLQVFLCFYRLGNWPVRYNMLELVVGVFFYLWLLGGYYIPPFMCIFDCGVLCIRCMLILKFMEGQWD